MGARGRRKKPGATATDHQHDVSHLVISTDIQAATQNYADYSMLPLIRHCLRRLEQTPV